MKKVLLTLAVMLCIFMIPTVSTAALSDGELSSFFVDAERAYGAWTGSYLNYFGSENVEYEIKIDGYEGKYDITDLSVDEIKEQMYGYFSKQIADPLIENSKGIYWIEYNGKVCFNSGYYGTNDSSDGFRRTFRIKKQTNDTIVYHMDIQTPDAYFRSNTEENYVEREGDIVGYDYVLEKNKDGKFIFTSYVLPKNVAEGNVLPNTSDTAVYITAAAGVIALCCAVICKKKTRLF